MSTLVDQELCRHGEDPHRAAAVAGRTASSPSPLPGVPWARQVNGGHELPEHVQLSPDAAFEPGIIQGQVRQPGDTPGCSDVDQVARRA
jgi:hypothetical protein